ncbi:MAG: hypothetical protein JRJ58_17330, partial [Deltaproteobacteria bacterium]|nr:hypothetical protein [Deltaproteobacteria bacterium]
MPIRPPDAVPARTDSETQAVRCFAGVLARLAGPLVAMLLIAGMGAVASGATLPAGFSETQIGGNWSEAVGMEFTVDGRL